MPRISTKTGSSASAAVLRNSSSTGETSSRTGRYHAIAVPSGTAIASARPNPAAERIRLALRWVHSWPLTSRSHHAASTSESGETK